MHTRCEYNKVALEASARDQASAGPAAGEDGHGATDHGAGRPEDEGGDENPWRTSAAQVEMDGGEMEKSPPPKRSPAPNVSSH